jgi:aldose 1-epimerase
VVAPSGEQYEIRGGGYRAVVTECGATLRHLEYDGRPLLLGFPEDAQASAGRGQLLVPWPNRIQDGRYTFEGRDLQLPVNEVARNNASHGLVRWAPWTLEEITDGSVTLLLRLMAQPGYPWTLDLHVVYDLSADGLHVTLTATNLSPVPAPYAYGAHPYLTLGDGTEGDLDRWELTLPATTRILTDERLLPVGREDVTDTDYDFRVARPIKSRSFDDAFTDLEQDEEGRVTVTLSDPRSGRAVALWMDHTHTCVQVYSGDDLSRGARAALAVEPMTAAANAFRTGEHLVVLDPAGEPGDEHTASWGIYAL